jgi:hypothetical protein
VVDNHQVEEKKRVGHKHPIEAESESGNELFPGVLWRRNLAPYHKSRSVPRLYLGKYEKALVTRIDDDSYRSIRLKTKFRVVAGKDSEHHYLAGHRCVWLLMTES